MDSPDILEMKNEYREFKKSRFNKNYSNENDIFSDIRSGLNFVFLDKSYISLIIGGLCATLISVILRIYLDDDKPSVVLFSVLLVMNILILIFGFIKTRDYLVIGAKGILQKFCGITNFYCWKDIKEIKVHFPVKQEIGIEPDSHKELKIVIDKNNDFCINSKDFRMHRIGGKNEGLFYFLIVCYWNYSKNVNSNENIDIKGKKTELFRGFDQEDLKDKNYEKDQTKNSDS